MEHPIGLNSYMGTEVSSSSSNRIRKDVLYQWRGDRWEKERKRDTEEKRLEFIMAHCGCLYLVLKSCWNHTHSPNTGNDVISSYCLTYHDCTLLVSMVNDVVGTTVDGPRLAHKVNQVIYIICYTVCADGLCCEDFISPPCWGCTIILLHVVFSYRSWILCAHVYLCLWRLPQLALNVPWIQHKRLGVKLPMWGWNYIIFCEHQYSKNSVINQGFRILIACSLKPTETWLPSDPAI